MSALILIIGNKNYSSWSLRPWVFMKQNQMAFTEKRIILSAETTQEELSQYASGFKVPVLQDGDLLIWDSLSILEYLSETYLQSKGWPKNAEARAMARSVSAEMHSSFYALRKELPMNCRKQFQNIKLSSAALQGVERITTLWQTCRTKFGKDGEWLFGEYTIADAMFAPVALRFAGYDISLGDVESAYVQSVLKQPAIVEWIAAGKAETEIIPEDEIET